MLFIFGWGRTTVNDRGPLVFLKCNVCSNEKYWHHLTVRKWFSLFFIPVVPYENNNLLLCPVCQRGMVELSNEMHQQALELGPVTASYLKNEITEDQYKFAIGKAHLLS
jgi:hypothetical protein